MRLASSPPETKIPTWSNPAWSSRARTSFTRPTVPPPSERGGVTVALVKEVRARLDQAGFDHVGIFVSGGLDANRIRQFEAAECPIHSYGVGMAISAAPPIAFTADIKEISGKPMTKRGRIPRAQPNERLAKVI